MKQLQQCSRCKSILSDGICPSCALRLIIDLDGLESSSESESVLETDSSVLPKTTLKAKDTDAEEQPDLSDEVACPSDDPTRVKRLGSYELIEIIGRGGMGIVYKALDPRLDRVIALKVLKPSLAEEPLARERFTQEARAVAAIEHENIIPIYEVEEDRGTLFLAMRLLPGLTLEEYLAENPSPDIETILDLSQQIAEGLVAAHERGVIHRDIKPGNLFLESISHEENSESLGKPRVRILDFGLARSLERETNLTGSRTILGTPSYMAPEQANAAAVDQRCDLFSLGCVMYQMVTGELPFPGEDTMSVLMSLANHHPTPPIERNPDVPKPLSDLILRLLRKDPEDRPRSAGEVKQTLATIPPRPIPPRPIPPRRWTRRWLPVGVAVCLLGPLLYLWGSILFVPTEHGTIRIEILDPKIALTISGEDYTFHHADRKPIQMTPGKKSLFILRGKFKFETRNFLLRKGNNPVLKIDFFEGKIRVAQDGNLLDQFSVPKPPTKVAPAKVAKAAKEPSPQWQRGKSGNVLAGMIPAPATLKDSARWQVIERTPYSVGVRGNWSPDGRWLACLETSGCGNLSLRLYDGATHKLARVLWVGKVKLPTLHWSPDSQWLGMTTDRRLVLFQPNGRVGPVVNGYRNTFQLRWSPDSTRLVTWGLGPVVLLTVSDGNQVILKGHNDYIRSIEWSFDGKWFASFSNDKTVLLRKSDGTLGPPIETTSNARTGIAWSPTEALLAVACEDNRVRYWRPDGSVQTVLQPKTDSPVDVLFWSPNGTYLGTCTKDGQLQVWDAKGTLVRDFSSGEANARFAVNFRKDSWWPDSNGLLTYRTNKSGSGKDLIALPIQGKTAVILPNLGVPSTWTWSPTGKHIVFWSGVSNGFTALYDLKNTVFQPSKHQFNLASISQRINTVSWRRDGKQFSVSLDASPGDGSSGRLGVADVVEGTETHLIQTGGIRSLAVHPKGAGFATGDNHGTIHIWDTEGKLTRSVHRESKQRLRDRAVCDLHWHPDGKYLVACDRSHVTIWDAGPGRIKASLLVDAGVHRELFAAFQPPSGALLAISGPGKSALWKWESEPRPTSWFDNHDSRALAWSPTGTHFATSSQPYLFNTEGLSKSLQYPGATAINLFESPPAWDPTGTRLLMPGGEADIRTTESKLVRKFGSVLQVAWSGDGKYLGRVSRWHEVPIIENVDGTPAPPLEGDVKYWGTPLQSRIAFSSDSKHFYCSGRNRIGMWDVATGRLERLMLLLPGNRFAVFNAAGELLSVTPGASEDLIAVVETTEGRLEMQTLPELAKRVKE